MFFGKSNKPYSLKTSRQVMQSAYSFYEKQGSELTHEALKNLEANLEQLDQALLSKDRAKADEYAKKLESLYGSKFKKSYLEYAKELAIALVLALIIAVAVRQMWFELYEIPTGSMRPTFKEQDRLTVTKTTFGINTPLETSHLYFDPDLVQRTGVLIFSADGLPMADTDSTYFGLFPYKKRLIKREIGKPGDTLYFYGGKIYGIDKDGNFISELIDSPWMKPLEHIPFMTFFEGEAHSSKPNEIVFKLMNLPIGKLTFLPNGKTYGEVYNGKEWVKDSPTVGKKNSDGIQTYSDVWGIRNYGMARLLTKEQVKEFYNIDPSNLEEGLLYLEIKHHPSLTYPTPSVKQEHGGSYLSLSPQTSILPLRQKHLDALMDTMYSARFVVKNGKAHRYSLGFEIPPQFFPSLKNVPDGTYEFYYGKAYKIGFAAISSELGQDFELYKKTPENVQKLFNLGIDFNSLYRPTSKDQRYVPHRYVYFRDGALYSMGGKIMDANDPHLISFNQREKEREMNSKENAPYLAFKDYGAPFKDGKIDGEFIKQFGLKIPEKNYLVLGDNHAMSGDSRAFGFLPEANIQGAPSIIIWPPGDRLGPPPQKSYPIFTVPRLIVWSVVLILVAIWYAYYSWKIRQPIFKKKDFSRLSNRRNES